jgi:hypothetical protein
MKLFVGIDVSSLKLDVCFKDSEEHKFSMRPHSQMTLTEPQKSKKLF